MDDHTILHDTVESPGAMQAEVLTALLEPPVCVNPVAVFGAAGRSALHQVVVRAEDARALTVAKILLEHGARPNATDLAGCVSARRRRLGLVRG